MSRRDTKEILELAGIYLPMSRCLGGHLVHSSYVCPRCESNNPDTICFKEKVRRKSEDPADYTDKKTRKQIEGFEVKGDWVTECQKVIKMLRMWRAMWTVMRFTTVNTDRTITIESDL